MSQTKIMENVADIFDAMGGTTSMARILSVGVSTASEIKRRGRIPAEYWRDIIRAAQKRGNTEITADLLMELHARESAAGFPGFGEEDRRFAERADQANAGDELKSRPTGHFTRFKHLRRSHFASAEEINAHINALRDEWARR